MMDGRGFDMDRWLLFGILLILMPFFYIMWLTFRDVDGWRD